MHIQHIYWHNQESSRMGEDVFKYCPLCGETLIDENIDQRARRVCLHCGYTHYRNPAPTVSLLIVQGESVLLGKRSGDPGTGLWATPSGYIEFEEDFITTAEREAKEETGLDVEIASILNVTDSFFPPEQHFLNIYLLAHPRGGKLSSGDDMGELHWYSLSGPLPDMAFEEDVDMIAHYRQGDSHCLPVNNPG